MIENLYYLSTEENRKTMRNEGFNGLQEIPKITLEENKELLKIQFFIFYTDKKEDNPYRVCLGKKKNVDNIIMNSFNILDKKCKIYFLQTLSTYKNNYDHILHNVVCNIFSTINYITIVIDIF